MLRLSLLLLLSMITPLAASGQDDKEAFLAAARKGDVEAVKSFLAKGMDVNTKTEYGATALSYAADKGHAAVVKVLLDHGADPNATDTFYKATPIIWASMRGHAEVAKLLLEKGARGVDIALMSGVDGGYVELVRVALEKGGASPQTLSQALARATKANRTEIIDLLKKAGAKPPPEPNFKVDAETLASYAGSYKNDAGHVITVSVKDGKLTGSSPGQDPLTFGAIDKTTFAPAEVDGFTIVFNIEGEKVVSFTVKRLDSSVVYKRMEQK
jgi:ankyrin repeat protein